MLYSFNLNLKVNEMVTFYWGSKIQGSIVMQVINRNEIVT